MPLPNWLLTVGHGHAEVKRTTDPGNKAAPAQYLATARDDPQSPDEARRLLHELQVYQAELQQQNEELRRLRAEVEAGLARYTDLYDFAPVGYLTLTRTGVIVQLNIAAASLLDQEPVQAAGRYLGTFIREDDRIAFAGFVAHTFDSDERQSCLLVLAAEPARTVHIEAARAADRQSCRLVMLDVSARIRAELQRAQLEAQLRESQKMEAIGTLAGGVAHDFNNILGTIIGNVALATDGCDLAHPARVSLDEISKAAIRAKRLVEQILSFSRRRPQQFVDQSLQPIVTEALQLMRASLPANISLTGSAPQPQISARVDAVQIEQVLLNVITNAWEAMPLDGGRISVELAEAHIDASESGSLVPGRYARILISDTGHGMDQGTLTRVYEPFFTTKPLDKGTGLGLAVAHGIMKDHGGSIRVRDTSSQGTTFELTLPLIAADAPVAITSTTGSGATGSGQHVLYLDDDEPMVYMVNRLLQKLGYRVSAYEQPEEALNALRSDPLSFDLVVTDYNMPGPSGLDVAREVAQIRKDLPVVITSGYITEKLREGARLAGVRHLIYKPNTVDELCQIIQRVLQRDEGAAV